MGTPSRSEDFARAVAAQLKAEAAARSIPIAVLASDAGLQRGSLQRWLNGERQITVATVHRLCEAIGIDPLVLFRRAKERFDEEKGAAVTPLRPLPSGLREVAFEEVAPFAEDDDDSRYDP